MGTHSLSRQQARNIQLAAQGLLRPVKRRARFQDISACISRMSLLQIDTINVVASSPYLVLFSRLGDYPPVWLDESLAQGRFSNTGRMKPVLFPRRLPVTAAPHAVARAPGLEVQCRLGNGTSAGNR